MNLANHMQNVYWRGHGVREMGGESWRNPHTPNTAEAACWLHGWTDAHNAIESTIEYLLSDPTACGVVADGFGRIVIAEAP